MVNDIDTKDEKWLSIGEAAELLGLSRDTLRRWEKKGKIKVYRSPTNRRIYKQSDLEELYKTNASPQPVVKSTPIIKTITEKPTGNDEQKSEKQTVVQPLVSQPIPDTDTVAPDKEETNASSISSPNEDDNDTTVANETKEPESNEPKILNIKDTPPQEPVNEPDKPVKTTSSWSTTENHNLQNASPSRISTSQASPVVPNINLTGRSVPEEHSTATIGSSFSNLKSKKSLPTTPVQSLTKDTEIEDVFHKKMDTEDETKPVNVLKLIAIILALVLVLLGITITILIFV